ncbi:MAG: hypothetical protein JW841_07625 [Deltaproteobacteria bacterium]|nr:hypothetical protein [Deltaproteobacteria bacterium]
MATKKIIDNTANQIKAAQSQYSWSWTPTWQESTIADDASAKKATTDSNPEVISQPLSSDNPLEDIDISYTTNSQNPYNTCCLDYSFVPQYSLPNDKLKIFKPSDIQLKASQCVLKAAPADLSAVPINENKLGKEIKVIKNNIDKIISKNILALQKHQPQTFIFKATENDLRLKARKQCENRLYKDSNFYQDIEDTYKDQLKDALNCISFVTLPNFDLSAQTIRLSDKSNDKVALIGIKPAVMYGLGQYTSTLLQITTADNKVTYYCPSNGLKVFVTYSPEEINKRASFVLTRGMRGRWHMTAPSGVPGLTIEDKKELAIRKHSRNNLHNIANGQLTPILKQVEKLQNKNLYEIFWNEDSPIALSHACIMLEYDIDIISSADSPTSAQEFKKAKAEHQKQIDAFNKNIVDNVIAAEKNVAEEFGKKAATDFRKNCKLKPTVFIDELSGLVSIQYIFEARFDNGRSLLFDPINTGMYINDYQHSDFEVLQQKNKFGEGWIAYKPNEQDSTEVVDATDGFDDFKKGLKITSQLVNFVGVGDGVHSAFVNAQLRQLGLASKGVLSPIGIATIVTGVTLNAATWKIDEREDKSVHRKRNAASDKMFIVSQVGLTLVAVTNIPGIKKLPGARLTGFISGNALLVSAAYSTVLDVQGCRSQKQAIAKSDLPSDIKTKRINEMVSSTIGNILLNFGPVGLAMHLNRRAAISTETPDNLPVESLKNSPVSLEYSKYRNILMNDATDQTCNPLLASPKRTNNFWNIPFAKNYGGYGADVPFAKFISANAREFVTYILAIADQRHLANFIGEEGKPIAGILSRYFRRPQDVAQQLYDYFISENKGNPLGIEQVKLALGIDKNSLEFAQTKLGNAVNTIEALFNYRLSRQSKNIFAQATTNDVILGALDEIFRIADNLTVELSYYRKLLEPLSNAKNIDELIQAVYDLHARLDAAQRFKEHANQICNSPLSGKNIAEIFDEKYFDIYEPEVAISISKSKASTAQLRNRLLAFGFEQLEIGFQKESFIADNALELFNEHIDAHYSSNAKMNFGYYISTLAKLVQRIKNENADVPMPVPKITWLQTTTLKQIIPKLLPGSPKINYNDFVRGPSGTTNIDIIAYVNRLNRFKLNCQTLMDLAIDAQLTDLYEALVNYTKDFQANVIVPTINKVYLP